MDVALHEGPAVVILDVPEPTVLWHGLILREPLLGEVSYCCVVCIRQKILHPILFPRIVLGPVHQPRPKTRHLQSLGHRTEGDLREFLLMKRSVRDSSHNPTIIPPDDHRPMPSVKHEPRDVRPRHVRQALGEDAHQLAEQYTVLLVAFLPGVPYIRSARLFALFPLQVDPLPLHVGSARVLKGGRRGGRLGRACHRRLTLRRRQVRHLCRLQAPGRHLDPRRCGSVSIVWIPPSGGHLVRLGRVIQVDGRGPTRRSSRCRHLVHIAVHIAGKLGCRREKLGFQESPAILRGRHAGLLVRV
mmetsp:Transcript_8702/g.23647  ORF Transcript_8702/g.23647 Transcript_8702/m.23647 type:complete len:301 (-) Transcript_8702:42-944(-)